MGWHTCIFSDKWTWPSEFKTGQIGNELYEIENGTVLLIRKKSIMHLLATSYTLGMEKWLRTLLIVGTNNINIQNKYTKPQNLFVNKYLVLSNRSFRIIFIFMQQILILFHRHQTLLTLVVQHSVNLYLSSSCSHLCSWIDLCELGFRLKSLLLTIRNSLHYLECKPSKWVLWHMTNSFFHPLLEIGLCRNIVVGYEVLLDNEYISQSLT